MQPVTSRVRSLAPHFDHLLIASVPLKLLVLFILFSSRLQADTFRQTSPTNTVCKSSNCRLPVTYATRLIVAVIFFLVV